jgi:hypothetical protein
LEHFKKKNLLLRGGSSVDVDKEVNIAFGGSVEKKRAQ